MEKIIVHTERLVIRNLTVNHLDHFYQYRSDSEITKYQGFDVMNKEQCLFFINEQQNKLFGKPGQWIQYAIEDISTQQLIGDCAIKLDEHDVRLAEIGITLSSQNQKKGYAKETLTGLLNWLFKTQNIHRVTEIVDAENVASIHLLKSVGFKQEGHFIENIFFKGKWGSEMQFAMLKKEWETR